MASGNDFIPLTLSLIEEGAFVDAINYGIAQLQHDMVEHVEAWGERAAKAKAQIKIEINLSLLSVEDGHFMIESKLSLKAPGRPSKITAAFGGEIKEDGKATGQRALFVRGSGSTEGDPTQRHLPIEQPEEKTNKNTESA